MARLTTCLCHLLVITLIASSTAKVIHLYGQFNTIRSTNYPSDYESNESRTWIVDRIRDDVCVYTVEFMSMRIQSSPDCEKDYLEINGQRFCGSESGNFLVTVPRGENLVIKFISDTTVQDTGFAILVEQNRFTCTDVISTTAAATTMTTSSTDKPSTHQSSITSVTSTTTLMSTSNIVSSTTSNPTSNNVSSTTSSSTATNVSSITSSPTATNVSSATYSSTSTNVSSTTSSRTSNNVSSTTSPTSNNVSSITFSPTATNVSSTNSSSTSTNVSSTTYPTTAHELCLKIQKACWTHYLTYPGGTCIFNIGNDPKKWCTHSTCCRTCQYLEIFASVEPHYFGCNDHCPSWIIFNRKRCYGTFNTNIWKYFKCTKHLFVTVKNDIRNKFPKEFRVMADCKGRC